MYFYHGLLDRGFVNAILGVPPELTKSNVLQLPGHCKVLARHAKILRLTDTALDTLVEISSDWDERRRLAVDQVQQRLMVFQRLLDENSGLVVLPDGCAGGVAQMVEARER